MDRVTQLRGVAGGSRDSTLDASSPPSEAYITANDGSSSKFFSLSEDDSTFDLSPLKDVSLASAAAPGKSNTETNDLISNLSPISNKSDLLDSYKIGKQIEAANILSGGVNIFDDNDNSYDGDELVIDDNAVVLDDKGNTGLKEPESELPFQKTDDISESTLAENEAVASKDTEVVLQIDGKNVNAIDIGNGLYLYRKEGEEELAAVQIVDDDQQHPSFKFLKVRENAEGNLEVYEEIEIEVPKEVPTKEGKTAEKNTSHVPHKDINKVISDKNCTKIVERKNTIPLIETSADLSTNVNTIPETSKVSVSEAKSESNKSSRMTKCNETKKSPFIHSTPNKEGIPLTKVMVNQQLHPNRHSDNVKTIEVHTDGLKQKGDSKNNKNKEFPEVADTFIKEKEKIIEKCVDMAGNENVEVIENKNEKQETSKSEAVCAGDTKIKFNILAKDVGSIVKPLIQKDCGANEKTVLIDASTDDTSKIETILMKDIPDNKDTSVEKNYKTIEISDSKHDKISVEKTIEKIARTNEKEVVSKEITDNKLNKLISNKEDTKSCETSKTVKNDGKCDLPVADKESTVLGESENKINKITEPKSKTNEEDMKKKEAKSFKQPESKNLTIKLVSVAPEVIEADIGKLDVNTTDQTEVTDNTAKEITKNIKCPENKDICLPEPEKEINILPKNHNREEHGAHTPNESLKIPNNQVKNTGDIVKNVVELDPAATINNEKLIISDSISTDKKEILQLEKNMDLVDAGNNGKHNAIIVQTPTSTSNCQPDKQKQPLEVTATNDIYSAKKCNTEILKETSLAINPVLTSVEIKQKEVEKKETPAAEPAATKASFTKLNTPWDSESKEISTKIKECEKKQDSPIKPLLDKTLKAKVDVVIKKKTEVDSSLKTYPARVDIVASSSALTSQNLHGIKKDVTKDKTMEQKPIINNSAAVPFGKWTEANRQEFLNKIKESKVPSNSSNANQIKQPNDLNRLDVLQKIDSQRQSNSIVVKAELAAANKITVKNEIKKFTVKPIACQDSKVPVKPEVCQNSKVPVKTEVLIVNRVSSESRKQPKQEVPPKHFNMPNTTFSVSTSPKTDSTTKRPGIYNQDLIDKTIEDIINRAIPGAQQDDEKSNLVKECKKNLKPKDIPYRRNYPIKETQPKSSPIDVIEMKMNELHGIPFVERPPHELPKVFSRDIKTYAKQDKVTSSVKTLSKIPNLVPFSSVNQAKVSQETLTEVDSEEEIIEHEPITGDIELNVSETPKPVNMASTTHVVSSVNSNSKKESIITENDFDKFARRNSITYENCLTVNFEGRDKPNVVHTMKEKDAVVKPLHTELSLNNIKHNISPKQLILHQNKHSDKIQLTSKLMPVHDDVHDKNYPSKLQMAYQSAITAKRQNESNPITIIEDRPVKVVYMDMQSGFPSNQLNVQGKDLSPTKKKITEAEVTTVSCDSVDSDMLETIIDVKSQDKSKIKHQRKQVLTPVDAPELELIEPSDLIIEHSPKKKRKTDDFKSDKSPKSLVPKKSYLLGRGLVDDSISSMAQDLGENPMKSVLIHNTTASAIDSLVKAAELLETQSENMNSSTISVDSDSLKSTPAKRGRGRPRKYPLPDGMQDKTKTPTPQKKPRLIDAKKPKVDIVSDDGDSSDEGILLENWTMGKINENIVCPICNKLFRSENVVFKHVKHCTGPSPNRSESDKKSPLRLSRHSQESDSKSSRESKSDDIDYEPGKTAAKKENTKKRKSKELSESNIDNTDKQQVIVIEGSSAIENPGTSEPKQHESRKRTVKSKIPHKVTNLACETCGKIFRQLSYLVNHKLQHEKEDPKKTETIQTIDKSVFTCEICKKEFRKLHHMVQHRLIHNPSTAPSRTSRKSSSEQNVAKEHNSSKQADDQSAAFRCEPCDKSFRKLHHLVEHRETHDGINRQKGSSNVPVAIEKSPPLHPQCDICKKTFRKLHNLIEHKEQHQETGSEKSDDRSVKSALSSKDIIHECSLCYMVFPNEHSLNKHSVICQRKKKQSAAKQKAAEKSVEDSNTLTQKVDDTPEVNEINPKQTLAEEKPDKELLTPAENNDPETTEKVENVEKVIKTPKQNRIADKQISKENDVKISVSKPLVVKRDSIKSNDSSSKPTDITEAPKKKKIEDEKIKAEVIVIEDTPKKKTPIKDKISPSATKKKKTTKIPLSIIDETVPVSMSSDDEEVRYMLNPDFKADDTAKVKLFMKVRANKRNSLQLERPNSKNIARRSFLQHPPKISRPKPKPVESKVYSRANTASPLAKHAKPSKLEPITTDSDDSDVKYSFPKSTVDNVTSQETAEVTKTPKMKRKSLTEKRKSLSSLAKAKSMGRPLFPKLKAQAKPAPGDVKIRRRQEVDYRCDCGQLFHSAALLSRHTTLAHTPPRIRCRRSPPPETSTKPLKPAPRKSTSSSVRSETNANAKPKKSVENKSEAKTPGRKRKVTAEEAKSTAGKPRRTPAHRGVPVPDKMKKLKEKLRK